MLSKVVNWCVVFAVLYCTAAAWSIPSFNSLVQRGQLNEENARIIGGIEAAQGEVPYIVSVQLDGLFSRNHICSGTILDEYHILTTAKCVKGHSARNLYAVAGELNFDEDSGLEDSQQGDELFVHDFQESTGANNIAILKLRSPITFLNGTIEPVTLPTDWEEPAPNTVCTVSGWGSTEYGGAGSNVLRYVDMPYITDAECEDVYGEQQIIMDFICAGWYGGKGICSGDAGSPLLCNNVLEGIADFAGQHCDEYPAVFTQISHYLDWIEINVNH